MNHLIYSKLRGFKKSIFCTVGRRMETLYPDYSFNTFYSYGYGTEKQYIHSYGYTTLMWRTCDINGDGKNENFEMVFSHRYEE